MMVGCIIRSDKGEWILGTTKYIGLGNPLLGEAWALYIGLQTVINLGITKVEA